MEIKVGKKYRDRNGGIIEVHYTTEDEVGCYYNGESYYMSMRSFDWYLFISGAVAI
jgi:hypothetical protein